jgi:hypothetical protein
MIVCCICMSDASNGYMIGDGMYGSTYHFCSKECVDVSERGDEK